jgi:hypothetical protein
MQHRISGAGSVHRSDLRTALLSGFGRSLRACIVGGAKRHLRTSYDASFRGSAAACNHVRDRSFGVCCLRYLWQKAEVRQERVPAGPERSPAPHQGQVSAAVQAQHPVGSGCRRRCAQAVECLHGVSEGRQGHPAASLENLGGVNRRVGRMQDRRAGSPAGTEPPRRFWCPRLVSTGDECDRAVYRSVCGAGAFQVVASAGRGTSRASRRVRSVRPSSPGRPGGRGRPR